jgi:non-canonical purine NTP pyrophosphatase (RdgB/HAM1 family)
MKQLIFATSNELKFRAADQVCRDYGVELLQRKLDIDEIQGEDSRLIALDKARRAYKILAKPVIISDDSWAFAGLNGFPGPYMSSMNEWLTPEDFLRLTRHLDNRRVVLTQLVIYKDSGNEKIFTSVIEGQLLKEVRGKSLHANHTIIALDGDNGDSIAERYGSGNLKERRASDIWRELAKWYEKQR